MSFFFPSDPEFVVLEYHYGYSSGIPPLRVSGDGTVRAYKRWASYSAAPTLEERVLIPAGTHTAQLSFDEINDLIRRLLDTGLLAFDEDLVQAQLREARRIEREETGIGHTTGDAGVHAIYLRLQEIRFSPDAEPVKDYELRVLWRERDLDLDRAVELYPEITELGRFHDAITILRGIYNDTIQSTASE
ncbi:MAG: hypothetical protein WBP34_06335 [Thermoanaerobaculia bacterium]